MSPALLAAFSCCGFFISITLIWSYLASCRCEPSPPMPALDRDCYLYDAPLYDPVTWNSLRRGMNCYAYALNIRKNKKAGFLNPGGRNVSTFLAYFLTTRSLIRRKAREDGLVPLQSGQSVPCGYYLVALRVRPGFVTGDFHWYRLDRDARGNLFWSHKPGPDEVRNIDDAGQPLKDLSRARFINSFVDTRSYPQWGGYFLVPAGGMDKAASAVTSFPSSQNRQRRVRFHQATKQHSIGRLRAAQ